MPLLLSVVPGSVDVTQKAFFFFFLRNAEAQTHSDRLDHPLHFTKCPEFSTLAALQTPLLVFLKLLMQRPHTRDLDFNGH